MIRYKLEGPLQNLWFRGATMNILFHEDKLFVNFIIYDIFVI